MAFPNYLVQEEREKSFDGRWRLHENLSAAKMAASGFFLTDGRQGDLVACYQCGIGLHKWSSSDEPQEVHTRLSHNCPLNKLLHTSFDIN